MSTTLRPVADRQAPVRQPATGVLRRLWDHRALLLVAVLFVLTAFIVPTRANVAILDDWVYIKQAQDFARHLDLHIRDQAAANAIFDTVWGGTFGIVLGAKLWVFRLSTVVLSLLGGIAMYALCRELGAGRNLSAFGSALLLFNPLYFVLSYTFMTDAHLTALVTMSAFATVRGLGGGRASNRWLWIGSAFAALAYLCRPQGVLLAAGAVAFLLVNRQIRLDRASLVRVARVALVPAVAFFGHQLWLRAVNGVPADQEGFLQEVGRVPVHELGALVVKLGFAEVCYIGLFLLPLTVAALLGLFRSKRLGAFRGIGRVGWSVLVVLGALLVAGKLLSHQLMPFIPSWFTERALGSDPLVLPGPDLLGYGKSLALTVGALSGAALLGFFVVRAIADRGATRRPQAGLVASLLVFQGVGAVAPSIAFRQGVSLDRYILPLFPLAFALGIWACRGLRPVRVVAIAGLVATAAFSVAGTHDSVLLERDIWRMDVHALRVGIAARDLDGGASWTRAHRAGKGDPVPVSPGAPVSWWVDADHRTSSRYLVAMEVVGGYHIVAQRKVDQWLRGEPLHLFLLEQDKPAG